MNHSEKKNLHSRLKRYMRHLIFWKLALFLNKIFSPMIPGRYLRVHLRPKFAQDINSLTANKITPKKLAIIIQGPVDTQFNFTLETILLYKKIFPGACLILSTWENEDTNTINRAKKCGAVVLQNKIPTVRDKWNVNLQLTSTYNALLFASEQGYEFSMKTRTDQRIYRYDVFDYLLALIKTFPLKITNKQHQRLVISSFATKKYRLYGITDFFMFGDTRDLLAFWGAPHYEEGIKPYIDPLKNQIPPIIAGVPIISEIYLPVKYIERLGIKHEWTLQHYWQILRDYFCVVDSPSIDMIWNKYYKLFEYRYQREYSLTNHRMLEFADWIQLYSNSETSWEGIREPEQWKLEAGKPVMTVM